MHTTNYYNTFIQVAEDCPIKIAEIPPPKKEQTAANIQFDMIANHPYKYTSDEVLFQVFAVKNEITGQEVKMEREKFFSKGQPCLRSSPLTKRYGWGVHYNDKGKIAVYPMESSEYKKFEKDTSLTRLKAMRSSRK